MKDFYLVKLKLIKGRYIKGIGKAYDIAENGEIKHITQDGHVYGHKEK